MLSHYTDEMGLRGIMREQVIWATEFVSLNDATEFLFGFSKICEAAYSRILTELPRDLFKSDFDPDQIRNMVKQYGDAIVEHARQLDGYGSLFIASFARGRNDDENARGILTLWDRYTRNTGYCLQFNEREVRRLVQDESERHSYDLISLVEVNYGIKANDLEYLYLVDQFVRHLTIQVYRSHHDERLIPLIVQPDPELQFIMRLMAFCACHKDSAFQDEREVRVLAYPARLAAVRLYSGMATAKPIYTRSGRSGDIRYLRLGEAIRPGLSPARVIVGPATTPPADLLSALPPHIVSHCGLPVRTP